jgi:prevent-host-death family protein
MQVNMHEAKSKLSQLVELVVLGEEVIIAKAGKPTVKLVYSASTILTDRIGQVNCRLINWCFVSLKNNGHLGSLRGSLSLSKILTQKKLMTKSQISLVRTEKDSI